MTSGKSSSSDLRGGTLVLQNEHVAVRLFQSQRLALMTRTAALFETAAVLDQCTEQLSRAVPRQRRAGWRLLLDMRLAPTRVHPALDPAFDRFRKETRDGFSQIAIVVSTSVGRMRAERLSNVSDASIAIFDTFDSALQFLDR